MKLRCRSNNPLRWQHLRALRCLHNSLRWCKSAILPAMPKKKAPELTDQERAKRIKEIAREVEADETGEAFRRVIEKVTSDRRDPRRNSRKSSRAG
jgi:hypothetical protein